MVLMCMKLIYDLLFMGLYLLWNVLKTDDFYFSVFFRSIAYHGIFFFYRDLSFNDIEEVYYSDFSAMTNLREM